MGSKKQETKSKPQETKEVATVQQGGVPAMPDYMKAFVEQSRADTGALVASSISVPRLSYRGKRWRFVVDGEEELVKGLEVNVVIIGVEPEAGRFIKTFYTKTYVPGDTEPPDCSSSNGVMPDVWVTNPQAPRCNQCPKNVFGSAQSRTGGKAKACHDSKRLWVTKADDTEIVYGLNVPIMSLKNLAEYGKYIARNNYPLALVVTELSMDDESEFPKLCFKHVGFVPEDMAKEVIELNQRRPWKSIEAPAMIAMLQDGGGRTLPPPPPTETPVPQERKAGTKSVSDIVGDWQK